MDDSILNFLSKIDFFSELSPQDLRELSNKFHWETYEEGDLIIEQGEKLNSLYLLYEGSVETFEEYANYYYSRKIFSTGSMFGGLSILTSKPSETTVRCLELCHVLCIKEEQFRSMLLRWPQIYQGIIGQLMNNLNEANQMLFESKYKEDLHQVINLTKYRDKFFGILGSVNTLNEVNRKLQELEAKKGNLLILGEQGTGRQMLAWYAHQQLFGKTAPFIEIDGRHFDEQWESFLDEPGNLKNYRPKYNLFNIAVGGTLFIKEMDQLSPGSQLNLAQKLRSEPLRCIVVASLRVKSQSTRSSIIPELQECFAHSYLIQPLRERKRDIPIIAQGVLDHLARESKRTPLTISPEATQILLSYHYKQGNVAELIRVMERAFFLTTEGIVGLKEIYFGPTSKGIGGRFNLLKWKGLENFAKKGEAIFWLRWITATMFVLLILGLFSPYTMVTTTILAFAWGIWWPALAVISPFIGRVWCTICPFSTIMDLIQDKFNPKRHVPDVLIKYDYLIVTFLFLLVFWIEIITGMRYNPQYTGYLLIVLQLAAIGVGILFARHAWCHHFCPLGGFIGTAAIGSTVEVRADSAVCLNKCTTVDCHFGNAKVKGCPMSQHLPYLDNNLDCKLCFNCLRSCPHDSVHVNLRIFAREVWDFSRVNQGYTIFIGVLFAILFPLIYFESVRTTWPASEWALLFTIAYFSSALLGGAIAWLIAQPFKTKTASLRIKLFFSLIPLVLTGHIIYQLQFVPGIHSLELGLALHVESGLHAAFIPFMLATQGAALMSGLGVTLLTIIIILINKK